MVIPYPTRAMFVSFTGFIVTGLALAWCDWTVEGLIVRLACKLAVSLPFLAFAGYSLLGHVRQRREAS
jgi:hypothetical protein